MLSEDALLLILSLGACALLVLGLLEVFWPTGSRGYRRGSASTPDPWRRARPTAFSPAASVPTAPADPGPSPARNLTAPARPLAAFPGRPAAPTPLGVSQPVVRREPVRAFDKPPPRQVTRSFDPAPGPEPAPSLPPTPPEPASVEPELAPKTTLAAEPAPPQLAPTATGSNSGSPAPRDTSPAVAPPPEIVVPVKDPAPAAKPTSSAEPGAPLAPPAEPPRDPGDGGPAQRPLRGLEPGVALHPKSAFELPDEPPIERLLLAQASAVRDSDSRLMPHGKGDEDTARPSPATRCYELLEARRYAEVLTEAASALERRTLPTEEKAKLFGLTGLAKQALGEHDAARVAFEQAIAIAPAEDRGTWPRHLAALALEASQTLLARARSSAAGDGDDRVAAVRAALAWLESGLRAVPDDGALRDAAADARAALWPAYGEAVNALLQRQEFHAARRLLREALADDECPANLVPSFRDLHSATFGAEIGQLTAESIRRMQEGKEDEALAALAGAEDLLATVPADGLPANRRQELERRLWWGYTKLGIRRVDAGRREEAVEPLLRALGFEGVGADHREETTTPLVSALTSLVQERAPAIERLIVDGHLDTAGTLCDALWVHLKGAMDRGVTGPEVSAAVDRLQPLRERLGRTAP